MSRLVQRTADKMESEIDLSEDMIERLANLDFFILDNSIRESTVGQLRSHTIENKKKIYQNVKKCGIDSIIVASFSQMHRVDDEFVKWLRDTGEDFSKLYSFTEVFGGKVVNGLPDSETIPNSLVKNKQFGLYNTVFEMDLADPNIAWGTKWTVDDMCQLLQKWFFWVRDNINQEARVVVNFRDFTAALSECPERLLSIVEFLSQMPRDQRPFALVFEDAFGDSLPVEMAAWTKAVRSIMDECGWTDGHLLNHIHEKWEMQTASTIECLVAGSDGVWASLCVEGAQMGHASSTVTLTNLIRMGNRKVLEKYNCAEFRKAAIAVTELTTTKKPHPKQCVYGARALDLVFGFLGVGDFNLGDFFGERTENRMTTLATPQMVVDRLTFLFGSDAQFTVPMAKNMLKKMLEDLNAVPPRKEEYQSAMGLAVLFDRSGGQLSGPMSEAIAKVKLNDPHHERLIQEIRELWDFWDSKEKTKRDGALDFDSFYTGFLAPYFGCYRCAETKQALECMDMDKDGTVDWVEFLVYIKWALSQFPDVKTSDEVIEIAFQKGLMPAMRDVKIKKPELRSGARREGRRERRRRMRASRRGRK